MNTTIKITVAEPSAIIRAGVLSILRGINGIHFEVFETSDTEEFKSSLAWQKPDILMINPSSLGASPIEQLKKDAGNNDMKCIALQLSLTHYSALKGYDQTISLYDNAEAIREKLLEVIRKPAKDKRHETLSKREKEIIVCVIQGMTNKQIAEKLFLSTHTVITHRRNISSKLQIHSTAGLTIYAIVNKLVELDRLESLPKGEE